MATHSSILGRTGCSLLHTGFLSLWQSGGYFSLRCSCFSLQWLLLSRTACSRLTSSVVVTVMLTCSAACGISPDQGPNLCSLRWQANSYPLHHQRSPFPFLLCLLSPLHSQASTVMVTSSSTLSFHHDFTHLLYDTEQITSSSCVSISSSDLLCTPPQATVQNLHIFELHTKITHVHRSSDIRYRLYKML